MMATPDKDGDPPNRPAARRSVDTWNPDQYDKFRKEREQPFFDLLAMVQPEPSMRVVDLGSGTGQLTRVLHARLGARDHRD